ncbi:MAG: hypothetical protein EXX96DRAFT_260235 [Benjaminiella poitrasii]|nr:MAG: hypothetical protein EXX96DRAFT_260235 [Benjaminiella poitrasii]
MSRAEQISIVHDNRSPEGFRYLGYTIVYTVDQRKYVDQMLLQTIERSISLYSTRSLSLRDRVTVLNSLILSQLWHTLCVFNLTAVFFSKVRTLIYHSVWRKKYPLVPYNHLCLPIHQGSLCILDPARQHLVLQFRCLSALFHITYPKVDIVSPVISSSLSRNNFSTNFSLTSFFIPEYQKFIMLNYSTCILNAMYKAFDHFGFSFNFSQLPIDFLLTLPLQYFFIAIPPNH